MAFIKDYYIFFPLLLTQESYQTHGQKEQQLLAELDTVKRISRAKDHQIAMLEQKLQTELKQKSKWKCIATQ